MKTKSYLKSCVFLLVYYCFVTNISFSQTYREAFDNLDNSEYTNYGQGASFQSNVIGILYNNESVALETYITMFKATKDKRYLDRFIIQAHRVQKRRDDYIAILPLNQIAGFNSSGTTGISGFANCIIKNTQIKDDINSNSKGWSLAEHWDLINDNCLVNDVAIVQSGAITSAMAEFVYLMQSDPDFIRYALEPVPSEVTYVPPTTDCNINSITTYIDFSNWLKCRVSETIDFHESNWVTSEIAIGNTTIGSEGHYTLDYINGQSSMGRTLAMMYLATGKSSYHGHVIALAHLLKAVLHEYSTAESENMPFYSWCYDWDCTYCKDGCICDHQEDAGHAYLSMKFADICFSNNIQDNNGIPLFNHDDMEKFSNTVAQVMYKSLLVFASTTGGSFFDVYCQGPSPGHYVFLSPYNRYLYQQLSDYYCESALYNPSNAGQEPLSQLTLNQNQIKSIFNPIAVQRNEYSSAWEAAASGDFNADGTKDFVAVNSSSGYFHIHTLGTCSSNSDLSNCINWEANNPSPISGHWAGIAAGDFNPNHPGDEFIALNKTNKHAYYFEQSGSTISNLSELTITTGTGWKAVTTCNLDGQPGSEALVLRTDGSVFMLKYNTGAGLVLIQPNFGFDNTGVSNAVGMVMGNFDPDNTNPQVAIFDNASGNIQILQVSYNPFFSIFSFSLLFHSDITEGTYNQWNGITAGDFDGDGIDEIMAHRKYDGQFLVFKVKNGELVNEYGEYFPVDQQNGVMCAARFSNFPDKDALVTFRNYDGQITIFNMDGVCPGLTINKTTVDHCYTLDPNCYQTNSDGNVSLPSINNNYTADFHANSTLTATNFNVVSGSTVNFVAGKRIVVTSKGGSGSSRAYSGSNFHAYIDDGLACANPNFRTANSNSSGNSDSGKHQAAVTDSPIQKDSGKTKSSVFNQPSQISIVPNPSASGLFQLSVAGNQSPVKNLTVTNVLGEVVYQTPFPSGGQTSSGSLSQQMCRGDGLIDISSHPKGIYFVKLVLSNAEGVSNGAEMSVQKIVYQ